VFQGGEIQRDRLTPREFALAQIVSKLNAQKCLEYDSASALSIQGNNCFSDQLRYHSGSTLTEKS